MNYKIGKKTLILESDFKSTIFSLLLLKRSLNRSFKITYPQFITSSPSNRDKASQDLISFVRECKTSFIIQIEESPISVWEKEGDRERGRERGSNINYSPFRKANYSAFLIFQLTRTCHISRLAKCLVFVFGSEFKIIIINNKMQ